MSTCWKGDTVIALNTPGCNEDWIDENVLLLVSTSRAGAAEGALTSSRGTTFRSAADADDHRTAALPKRLCECQRKPWFCHP